MALNDYTALRAFVSQFVQPSETEWLAHLNALVRKRYKKGELLVQEGQICNHVSFITKGSFRMYGYINEQEITRHFFFEHEYAADCMSFYSRNPSTLYIVALEDSEVLQLQYDRIQEVYNAYRVWERYGRLIAENLLVTTAQRAEELLINTPEEMYLKILKEHPQIIDRVPQRYIASYLGIQPESLSRIRKRLASTSEKTETTTSYSLLTRLHSASTMPLQG